MRPKNPLLDQINEFVDQTKQKIPIQQVILLRGYPTEIDTMIEIAIVVNNLEIDYLEAKDTLIEIAGRIHPGIEPILIDTTKADKVGFLAEIRRNGEIIFEGES